MALQFSTDVSVSFLYLITYFPQYLLTNCMKWNCFVVYLAILSVASVHISSTVGWSCTMDRKGFGMVMSFSRLQYLLWWEGGCVAVVNALQKIQIMRAVFAMPVHLKAQVQNVTFAKACSSSP